MSIERMPGAGASFIAACGSCGHAAGTHRADARGACRAVTMSVPGPDAFRMLCGCSRYVEEASTAWPTASFSAPFPASATR
jgi:hypothetical protein